jgi:hypothetical protein
MGAQCGGCSRLLVYYCLTKGFRHFYAETKPETGFLHKGLLWHPGCVQKPGFSQTMPDYANVMSHNPSASRHIGIVSGHNPFVMPHNAIALLHNAFASPHNAIAMGHIGNVSPRNRIVLGHIAFVWHHNASALPDITFVSSTRHPIRIPTARRGRMYQS